ncbi:peptidoglycan-binding domain-containing protein (plasmid) [Aliisedimentitalea scapharcae]|uniref:Peptidoglycan-binding domain-containing protein n=1 Tax=Aliisedimentitalea scapharcae TaxID=1524259 RepID=A0ABZ2XZ29_9RHOB
MQRLLDRILQQYPTSDLAVAILLRDTIDGVDLAEFDRLISNTTGSGIGQRAGSQADLPTTEATRANIGTCIAAGIGLLPTQPITIRVELNAEGHVTGIPDLVEPKEPDFFARSLFLASVAAIDGCAPYPINLMGRRFDADIAIDGSVSLVASVGAEVLHTPAQTPDAGQDVTAKPISPRSLFLPSSDQTEEDLELDKPAIRDIQARLVVLGFDPKGIDGVIGRGARTALKDWQASQGAQANGFLNKELLDTLKGQSHEALETWLLDPANEIAYNPPPPMPIGPDNMPGTWQFTSNCGSKSRLGWMKVTGALSIAHTKGGRYVGRARTSQGVNGTFSGRLSDRRISGEIDWGFLVGRVKIRGTVAEQKLVIVGRDANGCSFYAAKSQR